jgi:Na+-translocating ferredoxin:NAD+ oxidoreductase subunit B
MPNYSVHIDEIDQLLPQTQCGQCGYRGCRPYAEAMVNKDESIDRCPPGGIETLIKLAEKFNLDPTPHLTNEDKFKAKKQLAFIREEECIGCTKCIQACPVDSIIGAAKLMHTILQAECTGCTLCVPVCPVDCIELIDVEALNYDPQQAKKRFEAKEKRAKKQSKQKELSTLRKLSFNQNGSSSKKELIAAAISRLNKKRLLNDK